MHRKQLAFTLIEVSIVIVIIGLLIAGIIGGQMLVNQAKLRGIITDSDKYKMAYNNFNIQYDGYPGDFNKATDFFGATVTKNGTGNGLIHLCCNDPLGLVAGEPAGHASYENSRAWQHLSLAGILKESYSGIFDTSPTPGVIDYPKSDYAPNGYWFFDGDNSGMIKASGGYYHETVLIVNIFGSDTLGRPLVDMTDPKDAYAIDKKLDDGVPRTGFFLSRNGGCGTSYNLGSTSLCRIGFALGSAAK